MKVLIAEDGTQYVGYFAQELAVDYGHEVVVADNPRKAENLLASTEFHVVVADILFDTEIAEFERSVHSRRVPLTGGRPAQRRTEPGPPDPLLAPGGRGCWGACWAAVGWRQPNSVLR